MGKQFQGPSGSADSSDAFNMEDGLHLASISGNIGSLLSYLRQHPGIDVDIRDEEGDTALLCASGSGNVAMVTALLEHGADPLDGCHDDHECAIHRAASKGHVAILEVLLKDGVDINMTDHYGNTALSKAVAENQEDAVKFLLDSEAECEDCNEEGLTPLDIAVINGHADIVEVLLEHGASIAQEGQCETALHFAADREDGLILSLLLKWCTAEDINATDESCQTPLHRACLVPDSPAIGLLLDYDVDPNVKDKCGLTPLHLVAEQGNAGGAELLLSHGADVHATDNMQKTPLALAAMQGRMFFCGGSSNLDPNSHEEIVKVLLEDGADLENADTCGLTPLYLASERGCINAAMEMVNHGARVDIVDKVDSSTPLHHAVRHGSKRLTRALLHAGANADAMDSMGNRPIDIVPQNVEPGCVILHYILRYGGEYRKHNYSRFTLTLQIRRVRSAGILLLMHGASLREFHEADFENKTHWCGKLFEDFQELRDVLLKHRTYLELTKPSLLCQKEVQSEKREGDVNDQSNQPGPKKRVLSLMNLAVIATREHMILLQKGKSIWKAVCSLHLPQPTKDALLLRHLDMTGKLRHLK